MYVHSTAQIALCGVVSLAGKIDRRKVETYYPTYATQASYASDLPVLYTYIHAQKHNCSCAYRLRLHLHAAQNPSGR